MLRKWVQVIPVVAQQSQWHERKYQTDISLTHPSASTERTNDIKTISIDSCGDERFIVKIHQNTTNYSYIVKKIRIIGCFDEYVIWDVKTNYVVMKVVFIFCTENELFGHFQLFSFSGWKWIFIFILFQKCHLRWTENVMFATEP